MDTTSKHRMELRHVVFNFKSPKQPRKSQAAYQAEYRNRLKSNSQKWETYKTKQKLYIQNYRNRLTQEEKKERQAKQTQRNREKRKAQKLSMESVTSAQASEPPKRKTRMSVEETRAYWRDRKRRQREAMTKEQKQAVQRREYELYKLKRALSSGIHTQTSLAPTLSPPSEVSTPTGELPKKDTTNKYKMEPPHAVLNFKSPKQRRKSQATYQTEYRDRLKSNSQHWETSDKSKKLYQQSYQSILTEDEKREKQAKKNQRNREKRKAQKLSVKSVTPAHPSDPPKRKTRKSKEEKRVYWRNSKKLQGEVMTEEQKQVLKRQLNELCKIRRTLKSTDIHTQTTPALTLSPPIEISTPLVEMPKKDTTSKHRMELRHVVLNFKSPKPPRKSQAAYQAEYRNRLKSNRQKWETYKTKQKLYIQNYRNRLTQEEKKEKQAKLNQRNREKREAQKLSMESVTCAKLSDPPKRKTRKSVEDMRAYWRDKKRLEREAMTEEQKQAVRRRENEQYKLRKVLKSTGIHAQTTSALTLSPPGEIPSPAGEVLSQDQAALIHRLILASMHVAKLPTSTTIPVSIANKTCQTQVIEMS